MTHADLTTSYLGLTLVSPVVASASPSNNDVDHLTELQTAGVGAVVLPSLFEEQIEHEAHLMDQDMGMGAALFPEATAGHLPDLDAYNTGPDRYLRLIEAAADRLDIPVIASLNGVSSGGWISYARMMQDAGAHALELNIYLVAADPDVSGAEIEAQHLGLVEDVRANVSIPLAVKLGPYFSSPANIARRIVDAGADGLVLFNRFYQPDIDLDTMRVTPNLFLSTNAEMRLVLRWMAILRGRVNASLAATTGVHEADDVVKLVLAGADVAMMTSALLRKGPQHAGVVIDGVRQWFSDRGYASLDEGRGSLSQQSSPDPSAFERANYAEAITSFPRIDATI
ncbi:MAG: dihydroorotate dehydrogenase-like protein [Acidimicrobiales bacterium]